MTGLWMKLGTAHGCRTQDLPAPKSWVLIRSHAARSGAAVTSPTGLVAGPSFSEVHFAG
jgi:hypothetical protein